MCQISKRRQTPNPTLAPAAEIPFSFGSDKSAAHIFPKIPFKIPPTPGPRLGELLGDPSTNPSPRL